MPEVTARQICETALRLLGVAASEQPISADMAESALDALNAMLDAWSVERLLTYTRPKIPLTLVPGQATYTWGVTTPAADIPREPPVRLDLCLLMVEVTPPGLEWEIPVLDQSEFEAGIWIKHLTSSYPTAVYLEAARPVAVLHVWPLPDAPYTLQLLPWTAHSPYEHWDHAISWPNGYARAMQYGLACDLGPQYGIEAAPTVQRVAEDSKRALYPINTEVGRLSLTPHLPVGGTALGYPRGFREGWG